MRRELKMTALIRDCYHMSEEYVKKSIRESVPNQLFEMTTKGRCKNVTVICDPNFMHELLSYYHWGERNAQNFLEDVFRISGQVFYDGHNLILVPRFLLRIVSEERSKTSVVTSVANKQGAEYQNYILERSLDHTDYSWLKRFGPLHVIGHGHSHPDLGGIGVKPSFIDVADHRSNLDDHQTIWLSHIVDPIRGLTGFYYGPDLDCPKVVYMFYQSDYDLFVRNQVPERNPPKTFPRHIHQVLSYGRDQDVPAEEEQNTQDTPACDEEEQNTDLSRKEGKEKNRSNGCLKQYLRWLVSNKVRHKVFLRAKKS